MEWKHCFVFFPRRLLDGSKAWGLLMRRRKGGAWQYRKPSPAEEAGYASDEAW